MGVRLGSVQTNAFIGPLPASATETICFTTGPIGLALDNAAVIIMWSFSLIAGTATSGVTFRLRRGTTTAAPQVTAGLFTASLAAAAQGCFSGVYFDLPGVAAGLQYSLTIVQITATGAGTFNDGSLLAMVL